MTTDVSDKRNARLRRASVALATLCVASLLISRQSSGRTSSGNESSLISTSGADHVRRLGGSSGVVEGGKSNKVIYDNPEIEGGLEEEYSLVANPSIVGELEDFGSLEDEAEEVEDWPELSSVLSADESKVIGDVQFLLDFAIVGHAKTGTTAQMNWLADHEEVAMYHHEVHSLKNGLVGEFVSLMYGLPHGYEYKRGYKAPNDVERQIWRDEISQYFPHTKLIVGLRHPIKWYESYYNFNTRQGKDLPDPEAALKENDRFDKIRYHEHLAMFGKTPLSHPDELNLFGDKMRHILTNTKYIPLMENEVFLYEVSQPFDHDRGRAQQYSQDISDFIGLSKSLDPIVPRTSTGSNYKYAFDICDDTYDAMRAELIDLGTRASTWIRKYFLELPGVFVSNRTHFEELLVDWSVDPCESQ